MSGFGSYKTSETFTGFFTMLFSMPGEQLFNFVLELGTIGREQADTIVRHGDQTPTFVKS
jgi:hypothetical protein